MLMKRIVYDIQRGRDEKYPLCCVMWYSLVWGRISDISQASEKNLRVWTKLLGDPYWKLLDWGWKHNGFQGEAHWNRIACPKCIIKSKPSNPE